MEAIDAFFGQNWIDQAQREHPIHPNRGSEMRRYRDMSPEDVVQCGKWEVITYLMTWGGHRTRVRGVAKPPLRFFRPNTRLVEMITFNDYYYGHISYLCVEMFNSY